MRSIVLTVLVGMTLVFFAFGALVAWRTVGQWQTGSWPAAEGRIVRADYTWVRGTEHSHQELDLLIRYTVAGREYETDRWRIVGTDLPGKLRKGQTVTVYYNPDAPAGGVLWPGIQDEDRFAVLFALPLVCAAGLLWLGMLIWRIRRRRQAFGRPTVRYVGHTERVEVAECPVVSATLAGLLVGQLAGTLVGGLVTGTDPGVFPWLLAGGPAAMVLFAAVALLARRAGVGQIIIDQDAKTIRFKATSGMSTQVVTARVDHLVSVGVLTRQTVAWPAYSVLIRIQPGAGAPPRECRVGEMAKRDKYESLVNWLADRLRLPREDAEV